ncbi:hypothetical protein BOTBODRAFT_175889 [Botryobasidium botryosum FD-172 SS1]|uniref:Tetratricopeptide SHNi-TPR domain-containing protein n=1 Tax=Botryobasidium botryosum (strain FD-172 SS1) TaxID=930990 RepID=A0A067MB65_BOTB1|nr:hypothetical protein BOTBODRAFT_175889 [Botryobasidium botryosum FD-172 SS1]
MSNTPTATATKDASNDDSNNTLESHIELGKRAFALRKYEEAVDHYGSALELKTAEGDDSSLEYANLLFVYGKALLENGISQSAVLGKEEAESALKKDDEAGQGSTSNAKSDRFHFGGDEDEEGVDLLGEAPIEEEGEEEDDGEDDLAAEPEDDFNAAWEVLDLARAIFEKDDSHESKLKLGDVYVALGDVSLETEKFDQAITDFTAAVKLKMELFPIYSRQIAEAHYKLSMTLDLTPGRLSDAIEHAAKALESVQARLAILRDAAGGNLVVPEASSNGKGKGRAVLEDDLMKEIESMSKEGLQSQIKEFEELETDLNLKLEDLKSTPENKESAPEQAEKELAAALNQKATVGASSATPLPVNDLTSMVRKKKAPPATAETGKRKAQESPERPSQEKKKSRVDEE